MPKPRMHLRSLAIATSLALGAMLMGGFAACGDQGTQYAANPLANAPSREAQAPAPLDKGTGAPDQAITEHIRKSVAENDALSANAQNVQISAQNGVVTLRGPVKTEAEKEAIVAAAETAPGVRRVDDQLDLGGED